jgi:uncharacterized membrane protein YeiH
MPSIAGGGAAWWRTARRVGLGSFGGVVVDIVRDDRVVMLRSLDFSANIYAAILYIGSQWVFASLSCHKTQRILVVLECEGASLGRNSS